MKKQIVKALSNVIDPEVGLDIVSMGLIYGVEFVDDLAYVQMSLSTQSCPLHEMMVAMAEEAIMGVPGVKGCSVVLVFDPEWDASFIDEKIRKNL